MPACCQGVGAHPGARQAQREVGFGQRKDETGDLVGVLPEGGDVDRVGGEREGQISSIRQVALASFIGTAIEWYDFFLYGTAAALIFGELFFPEFSSTAGTLAAFSTYAVGFAARPLGGIVFGHYGDKIGRKAMLVLSLLIMGVATALIGLLPTFESIGVLAPILLVVLRFCQGIGVGGEWGGAVLMAVEHAPEGQRGFYGSWPQMGVPAGLLGGTWSSWRPRRGFPSPGAGACRSCSASFWSASASSSG